MQGNNKLVNKTVLTDYFRDRAELEDDFDSYSSDEDQDIMCP